MYAVCFRARVQAKIPSLTVFPYPPTSVAPTTFLAVLKAHPIPHLALDRLVTIKTLVHHQ